MDSFIGYKASGVRRESKFGIRRTSVAAHSLAQIGPGGRMSILHEKPFSESRAQPGFAMNGCMQGNSTTSTCYASSGEEDLRTWLEEEVASQLRKISSKMDSLEAKIDKACREDRLDLSIQGSSLCAGHNCQSGSEQPRHSANSYRISAGSFNCSSASWSEDKAEFDLRESSNQVEEVHKGAATIRWQEHVEDDAGGCSRISRESRTSARLKKLTRTCTGLSLSSLPSAVAGQNLFRKKYSSRANTLMHRKVGIFLKNFLEDPESGRGALIYSYAMPNFIILSVVFTLYQSLDSPVISGPGAAVTEILIDLIFMIETFIRGLVSPDWVEFCTNTYNLFDIIGSIPLALRTYLWFAVGLRLPKKEDGGELAFVRSFLLLVVPTLRLLKTLRWFEKFHLVACAFEGCLEALPILLWPLVLITLVFSSLIYSVEPEDNISSLPRAMWLTVVTMTTVGYGDVTPNSPAGSFIVGILVICSVLYMAMPLGIIGQAFTEIWQERDRILLMKRTRDRLMCWGYSPQDVPEIFKMFDKDGDGKLSYREFHKLIKRMGVGLKEHRILQLFEAFDEDATGEVDYEEFVHNLFPYRNLLDFIGENNNRKTAPGRAQSEMENLDSTASSEIPTSLSPVSESSRPNGNLSRAGDKDNENDLTPSLDHAAVLPGSPPPDISEGSEHSDDGSERKAASIY